MTLQNWLRTRPAEATRQPARRPRTRLAVETLEDRTVPTAVAAPDGLVSWWTANNTAADVTGRNPAALTNVPYTAGEVGQGWSFNGSNGWASLGDPASLAFTASFSIEGWVKLNGLPTDNNGKPIVFRGDDRGGLDPYQLTIAPNGDLRFGITGTTAGASIQAAIPTGQFVHVAATLDDATGAMTLYENGVVVAHATTAARPFGPLDPTQQPGVGIGNSNAPSNYNVPFNGVIDELAMYGRALTAGEVLGITKAGPSGKVLSPVSVDYPSIGEGAAGATTPVTFTIRRTGDLTGSLTVNWATADDTASAGSDYVAASGTVTFAPGEATKVLTITVNGDNTVELDETFKLIVTPVGGTAVMGVATIVNDDAGVSVSNAAATEGDARLGSAMGAFVSRTNNGGLNDAEAMAWGPDGNLYVGSFGTNQVLRFNGTTGAYLGVFLDSAAGLAADAPFIQGLQFRPDGKLYVLSRNLSEVQRFDATTGAYIDTFIPSGSGGLSKPKGMTVGPDGNWYISSSITNQVLRYDGITGAFLGVFVAAGSGGLSNPRALVFGPDGNLYAPNSGYDGSGKTVLRFNGQTGAFMGVFVAAGSGGLSNPAEILFSGGSLYVASQNSNEVLRYDAQTGAYLDKVASSGVLSQPIGLLFDSNGNLLVSNRSGEFAGEILRFGPRSLASFTVTLNLASATPVTVTYATASGSAVAGSDFTPVSGTLTFAPGETTKTILVSTVNDTVAEGTETFTLILSNAVGAAITAGSGVGTITDDDATKFFVADDGGTDRTYRYGTPGNGLGNTALAAGDTTPRGAASTAAGDKVWVADANKTVYVYSAAGSLLGSWAAGGLPGNARVEGIATDGTDVWLVDAAGDKVYRYAAAAGRLSGTQSAASTFKLTSADTNPKGIVTDGTSLWTVDDGASVDTVFKYTLAGGLLGSWAIDAANAHPTGVTLNPAAPSDLWVVDNVSLRVYQYAAAAGRTSGGQAASATFALAPGDTNPQDIADPPAGPADPAPAAGVPPAADWAAAAVPHGAFVDPPAGRGVERPTAGPNAAGVAEPSAAAARGGPPVAPAAAARLAADWLDGPAAGPLGRVKRS